MLNYQRVGPIPSALDGSKDSMAPKKHEPYPFEHVLVFVFGAEKMGEVWLCHTRAIAYQT